MEKTITVEWDYTERAKDYDKRADYSAPALAALFQALGLTEQEMVADIGAGTGKLTVPLLEAGFHVQAVEPNAAMRTIGIRNTHGQSVTWHVGTAEHTGLASASVKAAVFGSSFNVVDSTAALREVRRILRPAGGLACLWNHRDLDDPLQREIESIVHRMIPGFAYGTRREDPTGVINGSRAFTSVQNIEGRFKASIPRDDFMSAWRSHATLARQAGEAFKAILEAIDSVVPQDQSLTVPYVTRIWWAKAKGSEA